MNIRNLTIGGVAVLAVAILFGIARHSQHVLERDLPTPVQCANEPDAWTKALAYSVDHGTSVIGTSGTPSMQPLIVGRAVLAWRKVDFATVAPGRFILYHPVPGSLVERDGRWVPAPADMVFVHIAAARDAGGIIPTGLGNKHYENWGRVTPENFIGQVEAVFTWPQPR